MSDLELTDGWGDEEDLELDDDDDDDDVEEETAEQQEEEEEEEVVFHSTTTLRTSPASKQMTRKTLRAVKDAESKDAAAAAAGVPFAEDLENTNHTALDAWDFEDDDDDVLLDSATPSEAGSFHYNPPPPQSQPKPSTAAAAATSYSIGSFATSNITSTSGASSILGAPSAPVMVMDVDDDVEALYQELHVYVTHHLELLGSSINAILAAEYNTPDHAQHLVHYYQQRPQLAQYTLEKELTRMQYHVQVKQGGGSGVVVLLTDPTHIADYFQQLCSITTTTNNNIKNNTIDWNQVLLGASNQSLLADLLHVMTGPDRLVRPQYFTSCTATQCRFQMNLTQSAVVVTCHADFEMSLPCHATKQETGTSATLTSSSSSSSSRLTVATFTADITFQPSVSLIHYEISKLHVVLNQRSDKEQALRSVASFLKEMMMMSLHDDNDDDMFESAHHPNNNSNDESSADMFRDMFLMEQTQDFIKAQQLGMKSAWNQMGAVVNLQSKLETVGNLLPSLLSSGQEAFLSGQEAFLSAAAAAKASATGTTTHNMEPQVPREEEEEISFSNHHAQESDHSGPRLARSHHARPAAFGAPAVRPAPPPPPPVAPSNTRAVPPPPRPPPPPPRAATTTATATKTTNTTAANATDRPTSILGGFISRLAQSVTNIPDEEDIYRKEYGFSTTDANAAGASAIPQLYRRDDNVPPTQQAHPQAHRSVLPAPPSLGYSQPPPPPAAAAAAALLAKPQPPTNQVPPQPQPSNQPRQQQQQPKNEASVIQAHALPNDDVVVQDGWDDIDDVEDELLFEDDDNENNSDKAPASTMATTASAATAGAGKTLLLASSTPAPSLLPTDDMSYNPEDDIIEPRKRWVNPRPGLRQITL